VEAGNIAASASGMTGALAPERSVDTASDLELTLPARPENVAVARHAIGGFADVLEVPDQTLADVKLAVTEACTNVVVHAYDENAGVLEVEMLADELGLTIVVRDHGAGIQPRPTRSEPPALGLGLPLIAALSDSFELRGSAGQGTEVRMTFAYARGEDPAASNRVTGGVGLDGRWETEPGEEPRA
jgi:serine/threonine-protein kinase RsbW